jgi:pSer/pThr/pTyr-binding forkhead associated (FHA) protein
MSDDDASGPAAADEKTQPWRLRELAPRRAQRRRRALGAELTFKRARADVRVPLERNETVIGRDPGCDIVLVEATASARHARVFRGAGGYFELEDLGSTNGVVVDGEPVLRMTLQDGDTFVVGDTKFTIVIATVVGDG